MQTVAWTEERTNRLIELQATGLSAAEIVVKMGDGLTRNAVLGKCFRLGLKAINGPIGTKPRREYPPRQPRKSGTVGSLAIKIISGIKSRQRGHDTLPLPASKPFEGSLDISLADIGAFQCRWIQGNTTLFCGNDTDGGSWCPHHHAICFAKPHGNVGKSNEAVSFANRKRAGKALALAGVHL